MDNCRRLIAQWRNNGSHRSCFCCHVRTATISLGIYNLLLEAVSIGVTLTLVLKPDLAAHGQDDTVTVSSDTSTTSNMPQNDSWSSGAEWRMSSGDTYFVDLVINVLTTFFTASMLYGAVKGRAKFLLPYFCIQLFDFCVSCLVVVGYFTYKSHVKMFIAMREWFPLREHLLSLNDGWLMFVAGFLAILYLWVKAYFISIVWNCYKYLILLQSGLPTTGSQRRTGDVSLGRMSSAGVDMPPVVSIGVGNSTSCSPTDTQILLPPKYEDVTSSADYTAAPSPPPSYSDVIGQASNGEDNN